MQVINNLKNDILDGRRLSPSDVEQLIAAYEDASRARTMLATDLAALTDDEVVVTLLANNAQVRQRNIGAENFAQLLLYDSGGQMTGICGRLQHEIRMLRSKAAGSLANNLCPDHRDKQAGKPCLACEIERLRNLVGLAAIPLEALRLSGECELNAIALTHELKIAILHATEKIRECINT